MDVASTLTLITPYALIIVSIVSLFGNGTILLVVAKNASLRQKDCLYLIAALAVADFLTAAGTIPYSLNTLLNNYANCTVGAVFWSVAGNVSGVRMNQICTLFLALDRLYALYRPFAYHAKNHLKIAQFVIAASFVWSASEVVANVFVQDLGATISSCSSGMGFSRVFRTYRMYSNLVLNLGTQLLYVIVFVKIQKLKTAQNSQDVKKLQQANTTVSILILTSLIFMVIPSIWSLLNILVFTTVKTGSILSVLPCLNGAINVFIYAWKHREFKAAIKNTFGFKKARVGSIDDRKVAIPSPHS